MPMIVDKELIKQSIRQMMADRTVTLVAGLLLVLGVIYAVALVFSIHPSDVTVYFRYTAFGEAHFYKSHWQYLLGFIFFGLIVAAMHAALMVKLYSIERRQTALIVGWIGIVLLIVSYVYATAVIGLGYAA